MFAILQPILGNRSIIRLGWHFSKALAAATWYGFPARNLTVIGVTGTDGKTTTVCMLTHILRFQGLSVGSLSTSALQINDDITWNATQKTSPSPFIVQSFLRDLVRKGCTHAVLEYSSHGLVQYRTAFTWPKVAAITNLSREHLDYHGTLEQYAKDKALLFKMLRPKGTKVLNALDRTSLIYKWIRSAHTIAYAASFTEDVNLWLENIGASKNGATADVRQKTSTDGIPLRLSVFGTFNLENALCAIACASALGIKPDASSGALASFAGAPGRLESIDEGQPFLTFVDFTVTPNAYERTLSTVRSIIGTDKKLLVLTGSCGDRMKEKRPMIGKICSTHADITVVSNEDPYTEDPEAIIDDVWVGIDPSETEAHRISDRREAIAFLLEQAQPGDAVVLCGKGSDTMMWTAEGQIPWDERTIVRDMLKNTSR